MIKDKVNLLLEKFYKGLQTRSPLHPSELYVEVFENPDSHEVLEALHSNNVNTVRFGIDFLKRNLYVWNAEVLHETIEKQLDKFFVFKSVYTKNDSVLYFGHYQVDYFNRYKNDIVKNIKHSFPSVKQITIGMYGKYDI